MALRLLPTVLYNTLKLSGNGVEGVGFAIPINSTKEIYEQLIQYNKVKR